MHLFLGPLMLLAAAGFVVSTILNVTAWAGYVPAWVAPLSADLPKALIGGMFAVWLPAALIAQRMSPDGHTQFSWKAVLAGCPGWMRYAIFGLFPYAFVNFFVALGSRQTGEWSTVRSFSGHGMLFYGMAGCIFYSAWRRSGQWRARQCPLGHHADPDDQFCRQCGAVLSPASAEHK